LGRWWNFYERGRSFADGGFWAEAESDLKQALSIRSTDNRRSRTYGMHFTPYFGSREMGVVLFEQGKIEDAVYHLRKSLVQDPNSPTDHRTRTDTECHECGEIGSFREDN